MLYPQRTFTRNLFELSGIWDFSREKEGCDYVRGFLPEKQVAVPGSYNDLFTEEEFRMWKGGVWYACRFALPRTLKDERIVLRFNAVSYRGEVFLNGKRLGSHETGYTPFEFDITGVADFEAGNLLCVRVDNILSSETVPMGNLQNSPEPGQFAGQYPDVPFDFFPYAGIHRPVVIYTTSKKGWLDTVTVETVVDGLSATIQLKGTTAGSDGTAVLQCLESGTSCSAAVSGGRFEASFRIENVKLWDVRKPNLYHMRIRLTNVSGDILDEYTQRFGVRTVKVEPTRILLNGRPVYLQGFGRHEDFPVIGKGLNHGVNVRDHELLKWINANSYRTTHYPYSEELVQLADEQGFLLIAEAPAVSINFDFVTERTLEAHQQALRELIERDRNYPSVIMWSVANEATTNRPEAVPYFKKLSELVRSLDATRPVTMITCKAEQDMVMGFFDVVGINHYPGWYILPGQIEAAKENFRETLEKVYDKFKKPIFISEFGADTIPGLHSLPAEQWSEEYQTELILGLIDVFRALDYVVGEHIWNFADFRTAQNSRRVSGNKKGVFTRERQPKMVAHFLKKKWADSRYQKQP